MNRTVEKRFNCEKGITLFRGIWVPRGEVSSTVDRIKSEGLVQAPDALFKAYRPRSRKHTEREKLLEKKDLSRSDTSPSQWIEATHLPPSERDDPKWTSVTRDGVLGYEAYIGGEPTIFACGDYLSAAYYAISHYSTPPKDCGLVIQFQVRDLRRIVIDGRDLLFTLITCEPADEVLAVILKIYGEEIRKYIEKAWLSGSRDYRWAILDLAIEDPAVIKAHLRNHNIVKARRGVLFRSSFEVIGPIEVSDIYSISEVCSFQPPPAEIELGHIPRSFQDLEK
jgi:hypothetical protein